MAECSRKRDEYASHHGRRSGVATTITRFITLAKVWGISRARYGKSPRANGDARMADHPATFYGAGSSSTNMVSMRPGATCEPCSK